jgi:predicted nucleic acid-binding protein
MILLDTNVVSEAMKPDPCPSVRDWLDAQAAETLFLSSVTIAELLFGIGALPKGKRKVRLTAALDGVLELFGPRILPFDTAAARRYADLAVKARSAGKGFPTPDGYIAAIAAAHGYTVASRDTSAFNTGGLAVINPWTAARRETDA